MWLRGKMCSLSRTESYSNTAAAIWKARKKNCSPLQQSTKSPHSFSSSWLHSGPGFQVIPLHQSVSENMVDLFTEQHKHTLPMSVLPLKNLYRNRKKMLRTHIHVAPFHLMICNKILMSQSSSGLFSLEEKYLRTWEDEIIWWGNKRSEDQTSSRRS